MKESRNEKQTRFCRDNELRKVKPTQEEMEDEQENIKIVQTIT